MEKVVVSLNKHTFEFLKKVAKDTTGLNKLPTSMLLNSFKPVGDYDLEDILAAVKEFENVRPIRVMS